MFSKPNEYEIGTEKNSINKIELNNKWDLRRLRIYSSPALTQFSSILAYLIVSLGFPFKSLLW